MLLNSSSIDYSGSEVKLGFQIWKLSTIWQRKLNQQLKKDGLTHAQYAILEALLWLTQDGEKITQINVARAVGIDPMMVSNLTRLLEKKGLVKRKSDKRDTRAKTLELTSQGQYLITKIMPEVDKFDANFYSTLKVNNRDLADMANTLLTENE